MHVGADTYNPLSPAMREMPKTFAVFGLTKTSKRTWVGIKNKSN
jgi:hypothetical protein